MSEKGEVITSLEELYHDFKEILKDAKKSNLDDRTYIHIQGYIKSLEYVIHYLGYYFLKIKGDRK
jgi:uncharacterized coiled-coil DUF342 family protein